MIRFLLFLGLAVTFSAARPAPAEPKLEMGRSDTSSLYDDSRTKKIKEIINKFTPEQKKQIDDEKMLKEFIGKLNEILHYYDKELLPGVSPKVRKVLEAMEDMIKKPTTLMEKSKEEQQAQMLKYFEGMGVDDALQIQTVMLKLMAKAKELGIIEMHKKFEEQMLARYTFF
ncbi:hypothetical protein WR25_17230 [Diploscapter pachys]|uniref:SXP/RAL-2 family protein Ani s 5-like cation-binding domain-containing protein n=1 Tax=Diploscapter pachys TaxID=2018661 RepID=A0A2A2LVH4_9BILA|nr:hypothetical protein WR25_17230 [Diploscapter pachys]